MRRALLVGISLSVIAPTAYAQRVNLRVVDSLTTNPVSGALVALVSASGQTIRERLTDSAGEASVVRTRITRFEQQLSARGDTSGRVVRDLRVGAGRPFVTIDPAVLSRSGYVTRDGKDNVYYGPDARLVLSPEFTNDHC